MTRLLQAVFAWVFLAAVMFANGAVRVLVLQPRLGEQLARQLATGVGVVIVLGAAFLLVRRLHGPSATELWFVGATWLALTLLFEFGMGYASGLSWEAMLADYNFLRGRLWPLIPLAALVGPRLIGFLGVAGRVGP